MRRRRKLTRREMKQIREVIEMETTIVALETAIATRTKRMHRRLEILLRRQAAACYALPAKLVDAMLHADQFSDDALCLLAHDRGSLRLIPLTSPTARCRRRRE